MGGFGNYKYVIAMVGLQAAYAGVAVSTRVALLQGMSPRVFVVYRQGIATLVIAPIAYFSRRKYGGCSMGFRSFYLIFLTSLIGVTMNQNAYFEGLLMSSSSMATAMTNLIPAVTFIIAALIGLEKVYLTSLRSMAKILGTLFCVAGAMSMALIKGPKLLNAEQLPQSSFFGSGTTTDENWILGCGFLFVSVCCWSIWLILQVPASASYPDHLSLSAWMCFMTTIQSAAIALCVERDLDTWIFSLPSELGCALYSGIIGSGIAFFVQAWVVSQRGPLFSAMFNPLCTVIATVLAAIFLHEKIYTGGAVGGIGVIIGLYILLWGKAEDIKERKEETDPKQQKSHEWLQVDDSLEKDSCKIDLEQPLLSDQS